MPSAMQNEVVTLEFKAQTDYVNPTKDVELSATFSDARERSITIPGYWNGGDSWQIRFSSHKAGEFSYATSCSNVADSGLHAQKGEVTVEGGNSANSLSKEGPICIAEDRKHFAHASGKPFPWLGDTWWMGLSRRLPLDGLKYLIADRVEKGFTVIQIIAGLYPDMPWHDPRGEGDAGYPWTKDFNSLNPAYFQQMDLRLNMLIEAGLSPCVVGFWGYFMDVAGPDNLKLHWRNLIARYSALPVTWCVAGEGLMPYYLDAGEIEDMESWERQRSAAWSDMARWIRDLDGFNRPITIHPTRFGRRQVDDPETLDFEMLQTGHGGFPALTSTIDMLEQSVAAAPTMPVIISEVNYEGILESSGPEIQRFLYWSSVLSGSGGFTYGANGLWQVNGEEIPYGPSPHGMAWGGPSWRDASQLAGSGQIGLAKKLLDEYPWWTLGPAPHQLNMHADAKDRIGPYAGTMADGTVMVFVPAVSILYARRDGLEIQGLVSERKYQRFYFNPKTGEKLPESSASTNNEGRMPLPTPPLIQDWVFVVTPSSD